MLRPEHMQMLRSSAIDDNVIKAREYESITAMESEVYGFAEYQRLGGLLIPLWSVDGHVKGYQLRPDNPRINTKNGKPIKYETPLGQPNQLDVNPLMQERVRLARQAIFVSEGSKKIDSLASKGIPALGLSGVWNWLGKTPQGVQSMPLGDWEDVSIKGSLFIIAFDNDIYYNKSVYAAMRRLANFLKYKQAYQVRILRLPEKGV